MARKQRLKVLLRTARRAIEEGNRHGSGRDQTSRHARGAADFSDVPLAHLSGRPALGAAAAARPAAATDPQRGAFFKHGDAEFFIAWRGREPVGTICCAEDRGANATRTWRDSVIGFFECVDDDAVAAALFDHAADWARARGLDTLYGPFNLDYEDAYGVLLEGRDRPPALLCGHTPPYYPRFFDAYGFEPARGQPGVRLRP